MTILNSNQSNENDQSFAPDLQERLKSRVEKLNNSIDNQSLSRLYNLAYKEKSLSKKLIWLHRASDSLERSIKQTNVAACKTGCSHCCNIAVSISDVEASLLSKVTKFKLNTNPADSIQINSDDQTLAQSFLDLKDHDSKKYNQIPCPFLIDKKCSVYEVRPMACRLHYSLDDNEEACKLEFGIRSVPYLNVLQHQSIMISVLGNNRRYSDIRNWFKI